MAENERLGRLQEMRCREYLACVDRLSRHPVWLTALREYRRIAKGFCSHPRFISAYVMSRVMGGAGYLEAPEMLREGEEIFFRRWVCRQAGLEYGEGMR